MSDVVKREEQGHRGSFYVEEGGKRIGELAWTRGADGKLVTLDHTEVSPAARGRGLASTLVHAAVDWARKEKVRLVAVCPFAKAVFDREPALRDVLGSG